MERRRNATHGKLLKIGVGSRGRRFAHPRSRKNDGRWAGLRGSRKKENRGRRGITTALNEDRRFNQDLSPPAGGEVRKRVNPLAAAMQKSWAWYVVRSKEEGRNQLKKYYLESCPAKNRGEEASRVT